MAEPESDRGCMTPAALEAVSDVCAAIQNEIEAQCEIVAGENVITVTHVHEAARILFTGRVLSAAMDALHNESEAK